MHLKALSSSNAPNRTMSDADAERCTSYRTSTITCNGSVGASVDLMLFFEHARLEATVSAVTGKRFVYLEYGPKRTRGIYPKKKFNPDKKAFGNQVSFYVEWPAKGYLPNLKLFQNGNLQMTGIRSVEDGEHLAQYVAEEVRHLATAVPLAAAICTAVEDLGSKQFAMRMINSDFTVPYRIRRRELHNLMCSPLYNVVCSFQPGTYPGVKIQYFWGPDPAEPTEAAAETKQRPNDGRCHCFDGIEMVALDRPRGRRKIEGPVCRCKKVTISAFESGKCLITGANTFRQVDDAYAFITDVFYGQQAVLKRMLPTEWRPSV